MKIATNPEIDGMIADNCPVVYSVSGGKDSAALALATDAFLDERGHLGPRVLIHSDLGRAEWSDSLPACERLAAKLNRELVVVRRQKGDMVDRFWQRLRDNTARYSDLRLVQALLPWPTPTSMRYCTSEMKISVIGQEIVRRFGFKGAGPAPYPNVLAANGIRREESARRAKSPVWKPDAKATSRTARLQTYSWHPILDWTRDEVFAIQSARGYQPHEAYSKFGMSRVSCKFCIMADLSDLQNSASNPEHHDTYREMVGIETESTFSFQGDRWLADVAPELLTADARALSADARLRAAKRQAAESRIPRGLLYEAGWPRRMPTEAEAEDLASVRTEVAGLLGVAVSYTTGGEVVERFAELIEEREARELRTGGRLVQIAAAPQMEMFC